MDSAITLDGVRTESCVASVGAAESGQSLRERAAGWAGLALTAVILVVVALQLGDVEPGRIAAMAPSAPLFWLAFAAYYLLGPVSEWIVFRRLWRLPVAGIGALLGKQVANELVLGYSGEAQFYLWARRHAGVTGSPFGAVKDVAILSALAGNLATLAMMAAFAPLLAHVVSGPLATTFEISVGVVVVSSLAAFAFRRTLFSLPRGELLLVFGVHVLRIVLSTALLAAMWHVLLPGVWLGWWLVLATLRMMLSRLPLLPSKDVLFAGLTALMLGAETEAATAMALMGSLIFGTHLVVGAITAILRLADEAPR